MSSSTGASASRLFLPHNPSSLLLTCFDNRSLRYFQMEVRVSPSFPQARNGIGSSGPVRIVIPSHRPYQPTHDFALTEGSWGLGYMRCMATVTSNASMAAISKEAQQTLRCGTAPHSPLRITMVLPLSAGLSDCSVVVPHGANEGALFPPEADQ